MENNNFVAPDGQLLVIAEVSDQERSFEIGPPWLLTTHHIDSFESCGLKVTHSLVEKDNSSLGELGRYVTAFERA